MILFTGGVPGVTTVPVKLPAINSPTAPYSVIFTLIDAGCDVCVPKSDDPNVSNNCTLPNPIPALVKEKFTNACGDAVFVAPFIVFVKVEPLP